MMKLRLTLILWNLTMVTVVFLPMFILAVDFEMWFSAGRFSYNVPGFTVLYVVMIGPLALGSLIHSIALMALPIGLERVKRHLYAILLSVIVPGTVIVLRLPTWILLYGFFYSTIVATLFYALGSSFWLMRVGDSIFREAGQVPKGGSG